MVATIYIAKQKQNSLNKILLKVITAATNNAIQSIASAIKAPFLTIEVAFRVIFLITRPP